MEKELGPDIIKATQTSLGKFVKRPPLSEKLLKKPPFRFLHDVVTSVLKTNGFFEGLFDENELVSDNVKDRDSKISFLNKVISVTALTSGNNLSVKPSKIVAGQEPEKTNELLQIIAYCLDKKLSSDDAVKTFKENVEKPQTTDAKIKEKEAKTTKKKEDPKKFTSKSSEKLTSIKKESTSVNKNDKTKNVDPKSKRKETVLSKNESQAKKTQNLKAVGKKSSVESIKQPTGSDTKSSNIANQEQHLALQDNNKIEENEEIKPVNEDSKPNLMETDITATYLNVNVYTIRSEQEVFVNLNSSYTIGENELNSSFSSQDLMEAENDKIEDTKSNHWSTSNLEANKITSDGSINTALDVSLNTNEEPNEDAPLKRPRPQLIPKHSSFDSEIKAKELLRHNSHENPGNKQANEASAASIARPPTARPPSARPSSARPPSSRPGAPRLRDKIDNIIPEKDNIVLGKVNIIAENAQIEEEDTSIIIVERDEVGSDTKSDDRQDALQLLSNEHGHLVQQILNSQKELSQVGGKTEIEWQFGAQRAKEASSQEIEQLRFNIQALSRVANPLGKLLDHIQEDVEVMRQELHQWTSVYEEVSKDMIKQKAANEETLMPLQNRVKQMDVEIDEKRDKINDIKILIHKNTARIEKLLANGNVQ